MCVALLASSWFAAGARTYLVSVGVSDYPGVENDLTLPAKDAATIQYVYAQNKNTESVVLTNSGATCRQVKAQLQALFSKATANDNIVFFFSGHGVNGAFCLYDGMLSYSSLRKLMASSKARHKMVFADACFSGNMREGRKKQSAQSFNKYSILLFLSSRSGERSIEQPNMKNGYFTTSLQNGLRGKADQNHDRTITARELFNYVSQDVKQMSGDRQHPVMWGKFSGDMPVMKW